MESTSFDVNDKNKSNQNFEELFADNGGKDSNELDSFFEDLTSLDEEAPQPETSTGNDKGKIFSGVTGGADGGTPAAEKKVKPPMSQPQKKALKKRVLIILLLLLLLLLAGILYSNKDKIMALFSSEPSISDLFPTDFKTDYTPNSNIQVNQPEDTFSFSPDESQSTLETDPNGKYVVQVAVCMLQSCINDFSEKLQRIDYNTQTIDFNVRGEYLEMISEGSFKYDEASTYATEINQINNIMGNATLIKLKNERYKISLGNFFYLEDFKRVKELIESNISDPRVIMADSPRRQRAKTYRIIVGPFETVEKAATVQEDIRKLAGIKAAFIVNKDKL